MLSPVIPKFENIFSEYKITSNFCRCLNHVESKLKNDTELCTHFNSVGEILQKHVLIFIVILQTK
jgi:hypothetical protein